MPASGARDRPIVLETRGLTRTFGSLIAVDHVDFTIGSGELRGIIGPNGAGKTTFFHLPSGLLPSTLGRIVFGGRDVTRLPIADRVHLGISRSFQVTSLFPNLTVSENVRLAAQAAGRMAPIWRATARGREVDERTHDLLDLVGLTRFKDFLSPQLSHGDQRHLEIALALAPGPTLLLLDEPTAGMSLGETARTVELVRRINREHGLTVAIVEHDMKVITELADRITVFDKGRVFAEGTANEIAAHPGVQDVYLGQRRHASSS